VSRSKGSDPFAELYSDFTDRLRGDRWQPDVDVFETPDGIVVRAEIAGIRKDELRVSVDGPILRISGVRRPTEGPDVKRLHQMEIAAGPFERRVRIPLAFDRDRVSARLADGFLTVTLPRRTRTRVTIKSTEENGTE